MMILAVLFSGVCSGCACWYPQANSCPVGNKPGESSVSSFSMDIDADVDVTHFTAPDCSDFDWDIKVPADFTKYASGKTSVHFMNAQTQISCASSGEVKMPRISVRAIVIDHGKILLSRYKDERGFWHVIPGGGVEHGETIEEAFARETLEECGQSLPFGEVTFIREMIADRHGSTNLPSNFHQIEINIRSYLPAPCELKPTLPDPGQIDLIWQPLDELDQIRFYPQGLTENFMKQTWDTIYCGELA